MFPDRGIYFAGLLHLLELSHFRCNQRDAPLCRRVESLCFLRFTKATAPGHDISRELERGLPRSALGKACDYTLGRWGQLRRFLDYGQIELSNNLAENAIRPVAIGRTR